MQRFILACTPLILTVLNELKYQTSLREGCFKYITHKFQLQKSLLLKLINFLLLLDAITKEQIFLKVSLKS